MELNREKGRKEREIGGMGKWKKKHKPPRELKFCY
jgi:hypothetical protein